MSLEVLVVGLGPAGASAAATAARAGASVLAIDRKERAGVPVQCAEFVPMALCDAVDAEVQQIEAMATAIEGEAPDLAQDFRGRMIDRACFDQALVARAARSGADCRFGVSFKELSPRGTVRLSDGSRVAPRVIVGADGPHSRVAGLLGNGEPVVVESRQVLVQLLHPQHATDIFLSSSYHGGYAWLFPKNDLANLGIALEPKCRRRLKPLLETLRLRLISEGRIGEEVLGLTGGAIPVGGMNDPQGMVGAKLVLLAGDAAGLVNPVTGAGIPAAVMSGRMAGEAAARFVKGEHQAGSDYVENLRDTFEVSLARALKRRGELLATYEKGQPANADLRRGWIAYPEYWAA